METKTAVEQLGRKATIVVADLSSQESVSAIVPALLDIVPRIDILVNCAGIQRRHHSQHFPDSDWSEVRIYQILSLPHVSRLDINENHKW